MKKISRLLSILIIAMITAAPFMSFATEEASFDASGNAGEPTEVEAAAGGEDKEAPDGDADKLSAEPTEVIVVDSVEELSEESDAEYNNDAFFTIDASKETTSADLATDEVSDDVSDILSGGGSASEKQDEIIDTLEDSGFYRAEGSGNSKVEVTSKFAYQRLRLVAGQEDEINAYGATKAVYFEDSYLLSYDSMEATMQAYDALIEEYGEDSVFIDSPMKIRSGERGWGTAYMRMDQQKTLAENSGAVTVAVIDSGIKRDHPVFAGRTILQGRDFIDDDNDPSDDSGHGTAVCGVVAESTPTNVRIMPLKAMDAKGEGSETDVINAIRYANENGADIINMSIGGYLDNEAELNYYEKKLKDYDALLVCAAGNESRNMDAAGVVELPGELSFTVCVSSITAGRGRSPFSNYGQAVDFAAPGSNLMLANINGDYGYSSGTSFSAPYIASAAAIVKAGHAGYSNAQIVDYLKSISEDLGNEGKDVYFGYGCPRFPEKTDDSTLNQLSDDTAATEDQGVKRIYGSTRYQTAILQANELKSVLKLSRFDSVIVATGDNFADALSGAYLGYVKKAPVLLVNKASMNEVRAYIRKNLVSGGTIYLLGGKAVVSDEVTAGMSEFRIKRLYGPTRYDTNIEILKEAGVKEDIMICDGNGFADSLSVSAARRPILLVDKSLNAKQREFLGSLGVKNYYIIGGTGVIPDELEKEIENSSVSVKRLGGSDRYETSVIVAEELFEDPSKAVLAYGMNYPDGLCGGTLAAYMGDGGVPLLLVQDENAAAAAAYTASKITSGIVLGGPALISDGTARNIFGLSAEDKIQTVK